MRSLKLDDNNFYEALHIHTRFGHLDPFSRSKEHFKTEDSYGCLPVLNVSSEHLLFLFGFSFCVHHGL